MTQDSLTNLDEREVRLNRLSDLKKAGINAYPSKSKRTHLNKEVLDSYEELSKSESSVFCVGRIRLLRKHGGSCFLKIEDESSSIQVYLRRDILKDKYSLLNSLDIGDFIQVNGTVFKTKTEEITIQAEDIVLLTKSLRPLPDKWHGIKDIEERLRKRYLDLIMNKEVRDLFRQKSKFIQEFRKFYINKGFLEVQTPVLENIPGGAEAAPFITHHNTLDIDLYLRISLELHLKRLSVGGYEKIFEIGPVFRNEGMSTQHLQEFIMLESYEAYQDYNHLMNFLEELYSTVIKNTFGTLKIKYKEYTLDFTPPWPRHDYYEIVKKATGIDLSKFSDVEDLKKEIKKKNIDIKFEKFAGLGRVIDQLYKKTVRPDLIQPSFLINHPLAVSPLAKNSTDDPNRVERLQVLIAGSEVGNAFSELNDPVDQKNRFEQQSALRDSGDEEALMMDEDYIEALEHGMPPTAGFGVGIDRLFMICTGSESIRDVVFFPIMKHKSDNVDEIHI